MTRFNPKKNHRTPEEWSAIANRHVSDNNLQWRVIGGITLGLLTASAASPITAGLVIAWFAWDTWKKAKGAERNIKAITESGAVAQALDGGDFIDYADQVGHEAIMAELEFAHKRGLPMSNAALDYFEDNSERRLEVSTSPLTAVSIAGAVGGRDLQPQEQQGLIEMMSDRIQNHLIVARQGSGKGIVVSNALEAIKDKHPEVKIFYVDPKGDDKELGYFRGRVHTLKQIRGTEVAPSALTEWFMSSIKQFQGMPTPKLLILDEATGVSQILKAQGESNWLKAVLTSLTSMGDSQGCNIWVMCQNPQADDLGISSGLRSQFTALAIVPKSGLESYEAMISCKWLASKPKVDVIQEICEKSPVSRAYYYGAVGEWLPLPKLPNFSGYDRDTGALLAGVKIQDAPHQDVQETDKVPSPEEGELFTPLNLTREQALDMIQSFKSNVNQTELIESLWRVKKGGSASWKAAYKQFKELTGEAGEE